MTDVRERTTAPAGRTLDQLDEAERNRRFDELQSLMPNVWQLMRREVSDESVVVVPSLSLDDLASARTGTFNQAMEERSLFLLLLLRQPRLRMVYVTSMPISEAIVEYYLGLLPGVIPRHARKRLTLVSINDGSPRSLSAKLLEHPRLLRQVRELIPNPEHCHLVGYNVTQDERDIALSLGIPVYGCDPRLSPLGDKTGCRRLFEEVGIRYPDRRGGPAQSAGDRRGARRHARTASGDDRGDREAQRRGVRKGQCRGRSQRVSLRPAQPTRRHCSRSGWRTFSSSRRP